MAKIPAHLYGAAYLALVPLFALIYTTFPDGFYYSAATLEQSLALDVDDIAPALSKLIAESYRTATGATKMETTAHSFDLAAGTVTGVKSDGTFVDFRYEIRGSAHSGGQFGGNAIFDFRIAVFDWSNPLHRRLWQGEDGDSYILIHSVDYALGSIHLKPAVLLPYVPDHLSVGYYLIANPELWIKLTDFCQKSRGMAAVGSGSFRRMLYFSIVTITTLGYGDIVPLTDQARVLVGIEALLGVVLIGLFLNALTQSSGRH